MTDAGAIMGWIKKGFGSITAGDINRRVVLLSIAIPVVALISVFVLSGFGNLELDSVFHAELHDLIEIFAISVSFSIFFIRWTAFSFSKDARSLFIGITFLAIALIFTSDMVIRTGSLASNGAADETIIAYFFLASRFTMAFFLFLSSFLPEDGPSKYAKRRVLLPLFTIYLVIVIELPYALPGMLPYIWSGEDILAPLAVAFTAIITAFLALGVWRYQRIAARTGGSEYSLVIAALIVAVFEELSLSAAPYLGQWFDLLGHAFGFASFLLILYALFKGTIVKPYENLKTAKERIDRQHSHLARSVSMLETANQKSQTYFDFLAHDTANLISPIASYSELLQMDNLTDERVKKYAQSINEQIRKTASLIQNLRRLSTVEQVRPDRAPLIDIKMALAEAEDIIRHGYPKKRIIISSEMPEGEALSIGGEHVSTVITNVLDNALRFSKNEDVQIEKRMTLVEDGGRMFWRLEVADHGPGIDDETKEIFSLPIEKAERFRRGVACSFNFDASVLLHFGGCLIIEDRIPGDSGQGARIVLLLPRADPSRAPDD